MVFFNKRSRITGCVSGGTFDAPCLRGNWGKEKLATRTSLRTNTTTTTRTSQCCKVMVHTWHRRNMDNYILFAIEKGYMSMPRKGTG